MSSNNCSICGTCFSEYVINDKGQMSILTFHKECTELTRNMIEMRREIKIMQQKLLDDEFTLFCKRMNKHNN